jgi:CheY-like chemotaxis protein
MTKIMLVEDDKSLREIYGVRLLAEGYDIVSAGDGEEALAMAIKERPQLIISDVMMPKISGFDMLDILRSTTETKGIKVIMMTALSSDDQRMRGESLGADRYLVKSQVGIEDVVRVVHEVLADSPSAATTPAAIAPVAPAPPVAAPRTMSPAASVPPRSVAPPAPTVSPTPTPAPVAPFQPQQVSPPANAMPTPGITPAAPATPQPTIHSSSSPQPPSGRNRILQPLNDPSVARIDINELLDKELAREAGLNLENRPPVATVEQEKQIVSNQINQFAAQPTTPTTIPVTSAEVPDITISADGNIAPDAAPIPASPPPPAPPQPPIAPQSPQPPTDQPHT